MYNFNDTPTETLETILEWLDTAFKKRWYKGRTLKLKQAFYEQTSAELERRKGNGHGLQS